MNQSTQKILALFEEINSIPRCSKHEAQISRWLQEWADNRVLESQSDQAGNVVIRIPSTPEFSSADGIVIQGHMDMVCEKTAQSDHDFSKDPIRSARADEWLQAHQTTLGADNGIAIAMALALAEDKSVGHPALELLFTVDEETGLTGAKQLEPGFLQGRILLNIDSEDEGVFTVGCAGGIETDISLPLVFSAIPEKQKIFAIQVHGMRGGHSGIDIHKQRANANHVLARALHRAEKSVDFRILSVAGGKAHNAIPRDAEAAIACAPGQDASLKRILSDFEKVLQKEYASTDPSLALSLSPADGDISKGRWLSKQDTHKVIDLVLALPHGVLRMSTEVEGLVETSSNLAKIEIKDESLKLRTSQRSSSESRLFEITSKIEAVSSLAGAKTYNENEYPAWQPNLASPILKRCRRVYQNCFHREPKVEIIHAGLECGIIGSKYPGMDMISFGPTIKDPHSPDEKLHIPSVGKVWDFLLAVLKSFQS
jgi:dipeptidase D